MREQHEDPVIVLAFTGWCYDPDANHDKVWQIAVAELPDGRTALYRRWGRRQHAQSGRAQFMPRQRAMREADRLIREKLSHGYRAVAPESVGLA